MDPLTAVLLFAMAVLWLIRRGTEDITAMVTGREAPRLTRMRERRTQNRLTVTEAASVRIARFIAHGRDPNRRLGPLRLYVAELWSDSWEDARRDHEARRKRRLAAHQPAPQPHTPDPGDDIYDAEVVDTDWERPDEQEPDPPCCICGWVHDDPSADGHHYCPTGRRCPVCQTPEPPTSEPPLAEPPAPDPVQEPTRKEPPPMPTPSTVTVPGEVTSPREALAWADANLDTNEQVKAQLQYLIGFLRGSKLGPAALATVGAVITAADGFTSAVRGAQGEYAEHVLVHHDLASDPALRDTLIGYLDAAKV